jgi:hypothetical protein
MVIGYVDCVMRNVFCVLCILWVGCLSKRITGPEWFASRSKAGRPLFPGQPLCAPAPNQYPQLKTIAPVIILAEGLVAPVNFLDAG